MAASPTIGKTRIYRRSAKRAEERRRITGYAVAVVVAVALTGGTAWILWPDAAQPPLNRFAHAIPDNQALRNTGRHVMAVSPNGRHFVYNTLDGLYLRSMNELESRLIEGTEQSLTSPAFSPDGRQVAFFDGQLRRILITGGTATLIAGVTVNPFGMSWGEDGTILIGQPQGVLRVPATGGEPALVIESEEGEQIYGPQLLPGNDLVLFSAGETNNGDTHTIFVESLSTGERTELIPAGSDARYLPSGHIVYSVGDAVYARTFDSAELAVSETTVVVQEGVMRATSGITAATNYGVSERGTLIYLPDSVGLGELESLVWVGRQDTDETPFGLTDQRNYEWVRISPDGEQVAATIRNPDPNIWVTEVARPGGGPMPTKVSVC